MRSQSNKDANFKLWTVIIFCHKEMVLSKESQKTGQQQKFSPLRRHIMTDQNPLTKNNRKRKRHTFDASLDV